MLCCVAVGCGGVGRGVGWGVRMEVGCQVAAFNLMLRDGSGRLCAWARGETCPGAHSPRRQRTYFALNGAALRWTELSRPPARSLRLRAGHPLQQQRDMLVVSPPHVSVLGCLKAAVSGAGAGGPRKRGPKTPRRPAGRCLCVGSCLRRVSAGSIGAGVKHCEAGGQAQ